MDRFEHKPLAYLKRDVRQMVEACLGCELERLPPRTLAGIQRETVALRKHYRETGIGGWEYGRNRYRLVAYALAYYPYYVELISEAIQSAFDQFNLPRKWDLTPEDKSGTTRYAIVGCGAGPELYGLLRHLAGALYSTGHRESFTPDISVSLFEPERERWTPVADAVTKPLLGRSPWIEEQREARRIRINWSGDVDPIPSLRLDGEYDFVLIQLVLNEVDLLWPAWLSGVMESNVAPGGMICVIDTNHSVHNELRGLGFSPAKDLSLEWSEDGPRKLDPITSKTVFSEMPGLIERRTARARVSFWENAMIRRRRRLPPRRIDESRPERANRSRSRRIDLRR